MRHDFAGRLFLGGDVPFASRIVVRGKRDRLLPEDFRRGFGFLRSARRLHWKNRFKARQMVKKKKIKAAVATADSAAGRSGDATHRWTFLTNHAHVLIVLHGDPEMVLREVATRVGITERAVQRIILDLEEDGFIERERVGRRNRYHVLKNQALRHPIEAHRQIGDLLNLIARK